MTAVLGVASVASLGYYILSARSELPPVDVFVDTAQLSQAAPDGSLSPVGAPSATAAARGSPPPVSAPQPATGIAPVTTPDNAAAASPQPSAQAPALEPEIRRALGHILNTSSQGLVEETRDGVTSVDLQRRFQTAPVATVDAQGNVQITDYSHLPPEPTEPAPP